MGIESLVFGAPLWLAALAGLPVLWWLLRLTPPVPRLVRFPAVRLLMNLRKEETAAHTPWWLLLLRIMVAAMIIIAVSEPLVNPTSGLTGSGTVVLVVDDGWAAARDWPARRETLAKLVDQAERARRPIVLLTTAPAAGDEAARPNSVMVASEVRGIIQSLEPKPWAVDRQAVPAMIDALKIEGAASAIWLSDGLDDGRVTALAERLQRLGGLQIMTEDPTALARVLLPPQADGDVLEVTVARAVGTPDESVWIRASGEDGKVLVRESLRLPEGQRTGTLRLSLPSELRNRLARLEIEGETTAGAAVMLDERWRRRPVGIVAEARADLSQPLLADMYYLERALAPFSEIRKGTITDMLRRELAVLVLADVGKMSDGDAKAVGEWVGKGGVLVRFAGERLAQGGGEDGLLPVSVRAGGGRALAGAMSWTVPAALSSFEPGGPFVGLAIPDEIRIQRQILAEPTADLAAKTWARLADGTPLVTGERRGEGWTILVHTTASPQWSNLPISGLFVEMLRRLVDLSQGVAGVDSVSTALPPLLNLDGYGRPQTPPGTAFPIAAGDFSKTTVGPKHPPGYYGNETARRALNLSSAVVRPRVFESLPAGVIRAEYAAASEVSLRPWLLAVALLLALVDLAISLYMRGFLLYRGPEMAAPALLLAALLSLSGAAMAQAPTAAGDDVALDSTLQTRVAYVRTNDGEADEISRAGLAGLSNVLRRRTSVEAGPPMEVDIELDELGFFPLLYWPMTLSQPRISPQAMTKIANFLRNGGMIVFDTREGEISAGGPATQRLQEILRGLDLPALIPVPRDHVLTKAFYLMQDFPGRFAGATVWVEQSDSRVNDGVSSLVIGGNDWAAAWAVDNAGRSMNAVVPGGEPQREMAFRFGVNLVMYALAGNYKADQVHIDAILERMK